MDHATNNWEILEELQDECRIPCRMERTSYAYLAEHNDDGSNVNDDELRRNAKSHKTALWVALPYLHISVIF